MHVAVVIGGGRWGRILAGKLSGLGYRVFVATDFPSAQTDIKRPDIARLEPKPKLIYIASRSIDHEKDFKLVAALGAEVWIEKNFDGMSDALLDSFLKGENFVFSQQLFNTSLDRFATHLGPLQRFHIETEVEKPIETHVGLFDWICHDLSLIARILWLRGETGALTITGSLEDSGGGFIATYLINGISFRIELKESARRYRRVQLADGSYLESGYDGVLTYRAADAASTQNDLLGAALRVALEGPREDAHSLSRIVLRLHRETFPLVRRLALGS